MTFADHERWEESTPATIAESSAEEQELFAEIEAFEKNCDRYVALPKQFELDEYQLMVDYLEEQANFRLQADLAEALRGRGAFRRFKDTLEDYNRLNDWHRYLDAAYYQFAKNWCEENDIRYF